MAERPMICVNAERAMRDSLAAVEAERDRWHKMRDAYFESSRQEQRRAEVAEARLAQVEAERGTALNQVRHWKEQEAKQRRLRHEQGEWKHRALAAELAAAHGRDAEARLAAVEARIVHALRELRENRVTHAVAFLTGEHDDALRGEGDRPAEAMNDPEYIALLKSRASARPHPFHMSSYVGAEPRCWCDRYASDPIHGEKERF